MLRSVSTWPPPASEVSSAWGHTQVWLHLWVRANQARHRETDALQPGLAAPETSSHVLASQCCFILPQNPPAEAWVALLPSRLHSCLHTCTSSVCRDSPSCWRRSPPRMLWGQFPFARPPASPPGSTPCPLGASEGAGAAQRSAGCPRTPDSAALGCATLTPLPFLHLLSFTSRWFLLIPFFL